MIAGRLARSGGDSAIAWALAVVRRHAWLAALVFGVTLAGAATVAMSLPDIYRAMATVLVEHPGTTEGTDKSLIAGELETRLQTIGQEVLSQGRLMALMESFDLYPELRARGAHVAAVERLRRDIQVKLVRAEPAAGRPTTVAFSITFRCRDPGNGRASGQRPGVVLRRGKPQDSRAPGDRCPAHAPQPGIGPDAGGLHLPVSRRHPAEGGDRGARASTEGDRGGGRGVPHPGSRRARSQRGRAPASVVHPARHGPRPRQRPRRPR